MVQAIFVSVLLWGQAHAQVTPSATVTALLDRTLEVGASVTAGKNPVRIPARIDSPGQRLTARYGTEANLSRYGKDGSASDASMTRVPATEWAKKTMILAIDLFFWDSRNDAQACTDSVDRVTEFADLMKKNNLAWVIGTVPDMTDGKVVRISQPCRDALNTAILAACAADSVCYLADFFSMRAKFKADGGIQYKGKHYSFFELQPDGLHLSPVASEHVVDQIQSRLEGNLEPFVFKGTHCGYFEGQGPTCTL
ncbi:MAG: hypothetical protein JNL01_01320 [Bdellovibrionales bacterium]|nr:hypothetical protein [Bdellovibrionales bacterium]